MIKIGVTEGDTGVAGELIRLLVNHPEADIVFVHSPANYGTKVSDIHKGLYGDTELVFDKDISLDKIDVLFCCNTTGVAKGIFDGQEIPEDLKIIDFSDENRLKGLNNSFIYGLPELNRRATCSSKYVSNPGSVATCVTLALLPLAKNGLIAGDININTVMSKTVENVANISCSDSPIIMDNSFNTDFLEEVCQSLSQLQKDFVANIEMTTYKANFERGVFTTVNISTNKNLAEIIGMYEDYYAEDSFVHVSERQGDLLDVIRTNKCVISITKNKDKVVITSCIDNMIKGVSGQAVHNMNLMFNLEETVGLQLKS